MKRILFIILVFIAAFLAVVAIQPDDFRVERSIVISAPPAVIFAQVNAQKNWVNWSPWEKMDPDMKKSLEGPEEGVGSVAKWSGNGQVGKGSSTILESKPNEYIKFQLDFEEPMQGTDISEFTFKPEGDKTKVTWNMSGKKNFMAKMIGLIMNCEKMVGDQFDTGLNNLKTFTEKK